MTHCLSIVLVSNKISKLLASVSYTKKKKSFRMATLVACSRKMIEWLKTFSVLFFIHMVHFWTVSVTINYSHPVVEYLCEICFELIHFVSIINSSKVRIPVMGSKHASLLPLPLFLKFLEFWLMTKCMDFMFV